MRESEREREREEREIICGRRPWHAARKWDSRNGEDEKRMLMVFAERQKNRDAKQSKIRKPDVV